MKLKLKKIVFLLISLIFLNVSFANAETYDDCILNGLKNVTNDFIAKQIVQSCENKYSKSTSIESKAAVLPKITSIEVGHDTKWKIPVPEGNYVRTAQRIEYGQTVPRVYEIWENIEDGKLKHLMWVSLFSNRERLCKHPQESKAHWSVQPHQQKRKRNNVHMDASQNRTAVPL